jgi:hypothetical protein
LPLFTASHSGFREDFSSRQLVSVGGNPSPKLWTQALMVCVLEGHECRMNPIRKHHARAGAAFVDEEEPIAI